MLNAVFSDLIRWKAFGISCFNLEFLSRDGFTDHIWLGISGPGTPITASPDVILDPWQSGGFSLFPLSEERFEIREPLIRH
jgi:hypothetical protein